MPSYLKSVNSTLFSDSFLPLGENKNMYLKWNENESFLNRLHAIEMITWLIFFKPYFFCFPPATGITCCGSMHLFGLWRHLSVMFNNICVVSHFSTYFRFHTGLPANSASLTLPCLAVWTLCPNLMKISKSRSSKFSAFIHVSGKIHVICTILAGMDVITIAPTGSGKSLTYWMPLLFIKYGITVVVTPLNSQTQAWLIYIAAYYRILCLLCQLQWGA